MKRIIPLFFIVITFYNSSIAQNKTLSKAEINEIIETNFLIGEVPTRYYSNILIEIQGSPTKRDLAIVQALVDTLKPIIANWDIVLVKEGKANNLILDINRVSNVKTSANSFRARKYEIISRKLDLGDLTPNVEPGKRKK